MGITLSPELRLLLRSLSNDRQSPTWVAPDSQIDFDRLLRLLDHHGLAGLFCERLRGESDLLPPQFWEAVVARSRQQASAHLKHCVAPATGPVVLS